MNQAFKYCRNKFIFSVKQLCLVSFIFFGFSIQLYSSPVIRVNDDTANLLITPYDFKISPYTGYTRKHWIEITEKIIAGALPYFNKTTGMPELPGYPSRKDIEMNDQPDRRQSLERIMLAVIFYTTATGNDEVPGYRGSISQPFMKAIKRGTDPLDSNFWGKTVPYDQVGSIFSLAIYLNPKLFWDPLSSLQKKNLLAYLEKHAYNSSYDNNHYFFHMMPATLLEQNGYNSNRDSLTKMYNRLFGWYRGDGWFLDGVNRGFDYYNFWGFQLYNQMLYRFDKTWRSQFGERIKETSDKFLKVLPYFFGRDGGPIPFGRSLTYRFASNAAIAWNFINGTNALNPGEARRIASGTLKYFWDYGCFGENGLISIGYRGKNADVGEAYISSGSPYWASQGLACLLIPENDPFWTSKEQPMPADGVGEKLVLNGPEIVVRTSKIDGEARMYPGGQPFSQPRTIWENTIKYDQFAYSSYLGWCLLGEKSNDIGAGRTGYSFNGNVWQYQQHLKLIQINPDHIVSRYFIETGKSIDHNTEIDKDEIILHRIILTDGEIHILWHNHPEPIYLHIGGYGISAIDKDSVKSQINNGIINITTGSYLSTLEVLKAPAGKIEEILLQPNPKSKSSHLFGGFGVYPEWRSLAPVLPHTPVIFYTNGCRNRASTKYTPVISYANGVLNIKVENKEFNISVIN